MAALAARLFEDVVSTTAAQRAAAVCAVAGFVADASLRTRRVYGRVALAEVWRLLKVHQLPGHVSTSTSVESPRAPASSVSCPRIENPIVLVLRVDKDGWQELFLKYRTHNMELWGHMPAGFKLTAPWCAVTFTLPLHVVGHYLRRDSKWCNQIRKQRWWRMLLIIPFRINLRV